VGEGRWEGEEREKQTKGLFHKGVTSIGSLGTTSVGVDTLRLPLQGSKGVEGENRSPPALKKKIARRIRRHGGDGGQQGPSGSSSWLNE